MKFKFDETKGKIVAIVGGLAIIIALILLYSYVNGTFSSETGVKVQFLDKDKKVLKEEFYASVVNNVENVQYVKAIPVVKNEYKSTISASSSGFLCISTDTFTKKTLSIPCDNENKYFDISPDEQQTWNCIFDIDTWENVNLAENKTIEFICSNSMSVKYKDSIGLEHTIDKGYTFNLDVGKDKSSNVPNNNINTNPGIRTCASGETVNCIPTTSTTTSSTLAGTPSSTLAGTPLTCNDYNNIQSYAAMTPIYSTQPSDKDCQHGPLGTPNNYVNCYFYCVPKQTAAVSTCSRSSECAYSYDASIKQCNGNTLNTGKRVTGMCIGTTIKSCSYDSQYLTTFWDTQVDCSAGCANRACTVQTSGCIASLSCYGTCTNHRFSTIGDRCIFESTDFIKAGTVSMTNTGDNCDNCGPIIQAWYDGTFLIGEVVADINDWSGSVKRPGCGTNPC